MLGNSSASLSSSSYSSLPRNLHFDDKSGTLYNSHGSRAAHYLDPIPEYPSESSSTSYFPNSIGEYGMGRMLGRGAFGSVYEVTEIRRKTPLNNFKYAIKIVKK